MSEFLEVQQVVVKRDDEGGHLLKDDERIWLNPANVCSVRRGQIVGSILVSMCNGQRHIIRGAPELLVGPPSGSLVIEPERPAKAKKSGKKKWGA